MPEIRKRLLSAAWEKLAILAAVWACEAFIRRFLPNTEAILPIAWLVSALLLLCWAFPAQTEKAAAWCWRRR